jgi:hypothetical protein
MRKVAMHCCVPSCGGVAFSSSIPFCYDCQKYLTKAETEDMSRAWFDNAEGTWIAAVDGSSQKVVEARKNADG